MIVKMYYKMNAILIKSLYLKNEKLIILNHLVLPSILDFYLIKYLKIMKFMEVKL